MKKYKMILADIDHTIIPQAEDEMPERTRVALTKAHEAGYYIGIASGRSIIQVQRHGKDWGLDFPIDCICGANGTQLYDGPHDKEYHYHYLKAEWVKEIYETMKPFGIVPYTYHGDTSIFLHPTDYYYTLQKSGARIVKIAKDIHDIIDHETTKLLYRLPLDENTDRIMNEIHDYLEAHPSPNWKGIKTQRQVLEFIHKDCSKVNAAIKFCELNNFSLDEVIAFGDTTNDNEMLQLCGHGVCMKNGTEDTKACADEITELTCEEFGFADYLEKHLL